jgi:dihydroorotate dehydrogenase electron transfer subunit
MARDFHKFYTDSALRFGDTDPYPQRVTGEFIGTVIFNEQVNDEYRHIALKVHAHALTATAGQMFHLLCPSPDGAEVFMRRPMSVYRVDKAKQHVEFLYKMEGRGTRGMAMLRPGDDFNIVGPLGHGFALEPSWRNIVVLGRGVGLATLAPLSQLAAETCRRAIPRSSCPGTCSRGSVHRPSRCSIPTAAAPSRTSRRFSKA